MLLVVLGAGASFDSIDPKINTHPFVKLTDSGKPPLAKDLFNPREDYQTLLNSYPKAKRVVPEIRRRLSKGEDIEEILESINSSNYVGRKEAISSIRYYLRHLLNMTTSKWLEHSDGLTNYHTLVDYICNFTGEQEVYFVSFNYDEMLERALDNTIGLRFIKLNSYIADKKYKVIKPHGSIRWVQEARLKSDPTGWIDKVIEDLEGLEFVERYRIEDKNIPSYGYPLISIPIRNKGEFSCPKQHLDLLESFLPNVTHLLTIGWRGREDHFTSKYLKMLGHVKIGAVSSDETSARETINNLRNAGVNDCGFVAYDLKGFSQFVSDERWMKDFLSV